MKWLLIFFTVILTASVGSAQNFPGHFIGHWQGELQWYKGSNAVPQKVPVQLHILPTDTANHFTWQIIYGKEGKDNRPYILKPADTANGHWVIDERNGIVLDQYWMGGKFNGAFTVQNSTIINKYWLEGNKLMVEFMTLGKEPVRTTGAGTEEVPSVMSYAVKSYQKAVLYRIANRQKLPLRKSKK